MYQCSDYEVSPLASYGCTKALPLSNTASFDWEYAHQCGKSEYNYSAEAVAKARATLVNVMEKVEDIANVTDAGIDAIVNGYIEVNSICIPRPRPHALIYLNLLNPGHYFSESTIVAESIIEGLIIIINDSYVNHHSWVLCLYMQFDYLRWCLHGYNYLT